jgi:hypothetical protein
MQGVSHDNGRRVQPPAPGQTGKELYHDSYGEWRSIPGFKSDSLVVSSKGYVRTKLSTGSSNPSKLGPARLSNQSAEGYRHVQHFGFVYNVSHLVLYAFVGGPRNGETADHIGKHDGDFMRERGDDRVENLRWATREDQARNRTFNAVRSDARPILAHHVSWMASDPPLRFVSARHAQQAIGKRGVGNVIRKNALRPHKKFTLGGFVLEAADPAEDQADLVTKEDGVERWKYVGKNNRHKVSTHGRLQRVVSLKKPIVWSPKFTPKPNSSSIYAALQLDGKKMYIHQLVWKAFGSRPLNHDETIDHIDRDPSNNHLSNIRPATNVEQRENQGDRVRMRVQ